MSGTVITVHVSGTVITLHVREGHSDHSACQWQMVTVHLGLTTLTVHSARTLTVHDTLRLP